MKFGQGVIWTWLVWLVPGEGGMSALVLDMHNFVSYMALGLEARGASWLPFGPTFRSFAHLGQEVFKFPK